MFTNRIAHNGFPSGQRYYNPDPGNPDSGILVDADPNSVADSGVKERPVRPFTPYRHFSDHYSLERDALAAALGVRATRRENQIFQAGFGDYEPIGPEPIAAFDTSNGVLGFAFMV